MSPSFIDVNSIHDVSLRGRSRVQILAHSKKSYGYVISRPILKIGRSKLQQ